MIGRHSDRLQFFFCSPFVSYVNPSEVEESLDISRDMPRDYNFWIYIMTNRNHSVLYIGVTNRLSRRTWQHREGESGGFAADYRCKTDLLRVVSRYSRRNCPREPVEEMVPRKESHTDQQDESNLARPWRGGATGGITSRDFSTSLEMTIRRPWTLGAQIKIVTKARP